MRRCTACKVLSTDHDQLPVLSMQTIMSSQKADAQRQVQQRDLDDPCHLAIMNTSCYPYVSFPDEDYRDYDLFWISVLLDPKICEIYSHVRVIIVHEDSNDLVDMIIDEVDPTFKKRSAATHSYRVSPQSPRAKPQAAYISDAKGLVSEWVYTVVLKLTFAQMWPAWTDRASTLEIMAETIPDRVDGGRYIISYDAIRPVTPTSNAVHFSLENTHNWIEGTDANWSGEREIDNWYSIHILASNVPRTSLANRLPRYIITDIVRSATYSHKHTLWSTHWATQILSYAMVCKSWLHVCDLFWELLGCSDEPWKRPPWMGLTCAVHSLEARPALAQHIRAFDSKDWNINVDERSGEGYGLVHRLLMATAGHLRQLEMARNIFHGLCKKDFPSFRGLVDIVVVGYRDVIRANEPNLVLELQQALTNCRALRSVSLKDSTSMVYGLPPCCEGPVGRTPLYSLETLIVSRHVLYSPLLLHFVSGPTPSLRELYLVEVGGLTNLGLSTVLILVAQTLEVLDIQRCTIEPPQGDEEFAFDANISRMERIRRVHLNGDLASIVAFSQKPESKNALYPESTLFISRAESSIFIGLGGNILIRALEKSTWSVIEMDFAWPPASVPPQVIDEEVSVAVSTAEKRGLSFIIHY